MRCNKELQHADTIFWQISYMKRVLSIAYDIRIIFFALLTSWKNCTLSAKYEPCFHIHDANGKLVLLLRFTMFVLVIQSRESLSTLRVLVVFGYSNKGCVRLPIYSTENLLVFHSIYYRYHIISALYTIIYIVSAFNSIETYIKFAYIHRIGRELLMVTQLKVDLHTYH